MILVVNASEASPQTDKILVILSAAKDLAERSDTGRVAGVRSLHVAGEAPERELTRGERHLPPAPTVRSPIRSMEAALADPAAKLGARIVSSQSPHGCMVTRPNARKGSRR